MGRDRHPGRFCLLRGARSADQVRRPAGVIKAMATEISEPAVTSDYVRIFDTTLRDGEQSPGATMNVAEKVAIARQLERLNVDVIEAGFAASSDGDFES